MFEYFNFKILDDENFKEDSVREEIIAPLLMKLGYSATGQHKIIRSKNLKHPFIYVGTTKKEITIIPDYLLCPNSKPYWVLDAKSPKEDTLASKNIEQAYSYAIHPEIKAKYFALCNGKNFVLFSILKEKPLLKFETKDVNKYLEILFRLLNPDILADEEIIDFNLDWGLYCFKHGQTAKTLQINFVLPDFIGKVKNNKFSLTANFKLSDLDFCVSYDFDKKQYKQLLSILPEGLSEEIRLALSQQPFHILLDEHIQNNKVPEIVVAARLSNQIINKPEEDFLPLNVEYFKRLN